ncbi:MAG TPA: NAD-dependent succinate-semialdehyde dehydrogenase [Verrucomicrobiae bacterium]|jgi:succinate-semialdehyde dehydrogenase/glutarate-semialdehyde dehydrogenase|nr:NAD-dependent succinate-semialdehyde dehydrogenase [Verrucomicrobiae bacterium]
MRTYPVYLNGDFIQTKTSVTVTNPATGEPLAHATTIERSSVAEAVTHAHAAFLEWRKVTPKKRGEWLTRIANELERRSEEMARTITLENGKPLAQSVAETSMAIDHLRWFAEEARRGYGRVIPNWAENKRNVAIKVPIGVVGAISPWNFPMVLGVRKVAPALAAGCTAILKPARQTPLSSAIFAECVHAAGLPKGVFQLVLGNAADIAAEFLENPLCRKITFTGSTEVGQSLVRGAAAGLKPLSLELGGHGPCLVFDDIDLDRAIEGVLLAKFRNTGQSCIAANRIYVQSAIYPKFLEHFTARVKAMKVGDGLDPGVTIGPLIDQRAIEKAEQHVADAVRRGARLLCGGKSLERPGFFFEPTVLADVAEEALCSCEETFAPVAPIYSFQTEEEAIRRANNSPYGLSAYAFTSDLNRAIRLMEGLEAGTLGINDGVPTATQTPFGGMKMSGWGRELGTEGMDAFLETKHISIGL